MTLVAPSHNFTHQNDILSANQIEALLLRVLQQKICFGTRNISMSARGIIRIDNSPN
jgi:hypothetical protein